MLMMMGLRLSIKAISLLLILAHLVEGVPIDVTKYGAKANADIKQALLSAWKVACASRTPGIVTIPAGAYLLSPVYLQGPCNGPVGVQLQGSLKPSANGPTNTDGWIVFQKIQHLTLSGGGTLNAMGASAWNKNMGTKKNCKRLPPSIRFKYVNNSVVSGITTKDSKMFHMLVWGSRNLTFRDVTIVAPGESKNTDGIHISRSREINVLNSKIGTGDDCVSIGDGCNNINIQNVICGPGHGISIGSLGKYPYEQPVVGVSVKNCSLSGTTNGVRIKTWPGSKPLDVSDIHFEDITMNNVKNPIIIDQEYCGYKSCPAKPPSKVKISKVSFKNIHGSSASEVAVHLVCSKGVPCQDVQLGNIDLTYRGGAAKSQQANVKPTITGKSNVH